MKNYLIEDFIQRANLIEDIIIEGIDDVKKKFPNIDDATFFKLIKLDPTYKEGIDSVGTYGKWLLSLYNKTKKIPDNSITSILDKFDKNKRYLQASERDIGKYKSIEDLEQKVNSIEPHEASDARKNKDIRKAIRKTNLVDDAEYVGTFDDFEVYVPKTYEASCKLGQGTTWCTATNSTSHYYDNYSKDGPLYIIINTKNPSEKYQLHVESNQFKNKDDEELNTTELVTLYKERPELWKFIKKVSSGNSYLTDKYDEIEKKWEKYIEIGEVLNQYINFDIRLPDTRYESFVENIIDYYFGNKDFDNLLTLLCCTFVSSKDAYVEQLDDLLTDYALEDMYEILNAQSDYICSTILEINYLKEIVENKYNVKLETEVDVQEAINSNEDLEQSIFDCVYNEMLHSLDEQYHKDYTNFLYSRLQNYVFVKDVQNGFITVEGKVIDILNALHDTYYIADYVDYGAAEDIIDILDKFDWNTAEDIVSAIIPIFIINESLGTNQGYFKNYIEGTYPEFDLTTLGDYL